MKRRARRRPVASRRGMSLIEVMVSVGILGFGAAALTNMFTSTAQGVRQSRHDATATQIAVQRLEFLASQGVDRLPTCGGVPSCRVSMKSFAAAMSDDGSYRCSQIVDGMDLNDPTVNVANGRYRIDTVVTQPADARQIDGARLVQVNVCWFDGRSVHVRQAERLLVPEL